MRETGLHREDVEVSSSTCKRNRDISCLHVAEVCSHVSSHARRTFQKAVNQLRSQRFLHNRNIVVLLPILTSCLLSSCTANMMNDLVTSSHVECHVTRNAARISKRSRISGYTHINSHVQYLKLLEKNKYWEKLNLKPEQGICETNTFVTKKFDCSSISRRNLFGSDTEQKSGTDQIKIESHTVDGEMYEGFRNEVFLSSSRAAIFFDFDKTLSADHIHDLMKASRKGLSGIFV